jgi:uncharacterized protein
MLTLAQSATALLSQAKDSLLASPPVLFFFLGAFAALVKSNLSVPKPVTKLLSLYLLWAIGFKGGVELTHSGLSPDALKAVFAGIALACIVPLYTFACMRRLTTLPNAAALAATYGSISAVTFMAASTVLEARGIPFGGHMVAVMALMESPAIVIAVVLLRRAQRQKAQQEKGQGAAGTNATDASQTSHGWGKLLHEAFLNGAVIVLLGSLLIGILTGDRGYATFKPLAGDVFPGVLVFFLLDLGLLAARRLKDLRSAGWKVAALGIAIPLANAVLAMLLARALHMPRGDAILLITLASSASYIAVPAAVRLVIPQATPGLYVPMALAVTFPFNIAIGIPLYIAMVPGG